jgi:hypothetical protein
VLPLHGNTAILVQIRWDADRLGDTGSIISLEHRSRAPIKATSGGMTLPLAPGEYALYPAGLPCQGQPPGTMRGRRFLVDGGRVYAYDRLRPLALIPDEGVQIPRDPPMEGRLAYAGSIDGAARIIVEWTTAPGPHCLCLRSKEWGEHWLPFALDGSTAGLCLFDGAYEVRLARLTEDEAARGPWSNRIAFSVAEGRLAIAPDGAADALYDGLMVRGGWRLQTDLDVAGVVREDGTVLADLRWDPAGSDDLRYLVAFLPEFAERWTVALTDRPEHRLVLAAGRYRTRLCAIDDAVLWRSEFFGEKVIEVSRSEPAIAMLDPAPSPLEEVLGWEPLPQADEAAAEFDAVLLGLTHEPLSPLVDQAHTVDPERLSFRDLTHQRAHPGGEIAATRKFAARRLEPPDIAAVGEFFLQIGDLSNARLAFEAFGRRFRGRDFARLHLAQVAEAEGFRREAHDLWQAGSAAGPKSAPTPALSLRADAKSARSQVKEQERQLPASAASPQRADAKSARSQVKEQARQLHASATKISQLEDQIALAKQREKQLKETIGSLRYKARQYEAIRQELPSLRYKARRYDEVRDRLPGWQSKAERYDRLNANGWRKLVRKIPGIWPLRKGRHSEG